MKRKQTMLSPFPRKWLGAAFALALLVASFTNTFAQQKHEPEKAEPLTIGSTISTVLSIGTSAFDEASRLVESDPYWQFRNAQYSNEGLISERDEVRLGTQLNIQGSKKIKFAREGQERVNPIGHVVARHSLKTIQQSQTLGGLANLFGSITGIAGDSAQELGTAAAQIVAGGLLAVHNREEEREADFLGIHGMAKAGFNPQGMLTMFQKIQKVSESDSDLLGAIFADHPGVEERIENTRYEINRMRGAK